MSVRDMYITLLEKRAAHVEAEAERATQSQHANRADGARDLRERFDRATASGREASQTLRAALPTARSAPDTTTSSSLLKVAMHRAFFDGVRRMGRLKTAGADYLHTAYCAFEDELTKILG